MSPRINPPANQSAGLCRHETGRHETVCRECPIATPPSIAGPFCEIDPDEKLIVAEGHFADPSEPGRSGPDARKMGRAFASIDHRHRNRNREKTPDGPAR
jgi:hypothetical protein